MKREDAMFLKELNKTHKKHIQNWSAIPLIIMEKDSEISKKATDIAREVYSIIANNKRDTKERSDKVNSTFDKMFDMPIKEFMFLNKVVKINDPETYGTMKYNYMKLSCYDKGIKLYYPTLHDGTSIVQIDTDNEEGTPIISFFTKNEVTGNTEEENKSEIRQFLSATIITVLAFFKEIELAGLFSVEAKGISHRKHNAKKPWQRSDLVSIRFLNKMPTEHKEHQGGTHQSPRYHFRRGTKRKLTHPRYKNHPKYGQEINVKSSWVGAKEATVNNITYKVLG